MNIETAQYTLGADGVTKTAIRATINGLEMHVAIDPDNRHYAAILEWAKEDGNEIQAAE